MHLAYLLYAYNGGKHLSNSLKMQRTLPERFAPSHGINIALETCVHSQSWEEINIVISFMKRHLYTSLCIHNIDEL